MADPRAFMRETVAASCDTVEPHALGTLLVTPSLDAVYALNGVIVEGPRPDLALDELDRLFDERFAQGRYASAVLWDEPTAARVEEQARDRGWTIEHELVMELRREPDRIADLSGVREGREEEVRSLTDRWFAEDFPDVGDEELRQLSEYAGREWRARPTRAFVSPDGQAMCKLWSDGAIAQVENVYTAPEARGGGHARALVTKAILEAREGDPELVFIVADADGTPKQLYERLGFDAREVHTRVVRKNDAWRAG